MSSFRKNEWVLSYYGEGSAEVRIVRVAEDTWDGKDSTLCYMGKHFTTKYPTSGLHKMPASMKKLLPKDKDGKFHTTFM